MSEKEIQSSTIQETIVYSTLESYQHAVLLSQLHSVEFLTMGMGFDLLALDLLPLRLDVLCCRGVSGTEPVEGEVGIVEVGDILP